MENAMVGAKEIDSIKFTSLQNDHFWVENMQIDYDFLIKY